ncbi:hypothetical protein A5758_12915 [Mycobacterium sp. 852014-50255_SCH5639931]|nr:hypothetical protein A5758_12915 [Mycobacterium sp. 852014-50255_SCH5639931]
MIVGTVGLDCGGDEAGNGAVDAVGRVLAATGVGIERPFLHVGDHAVHGHSAIELATNSVGCGDEARDVLERRDSFLVEQRHKLIVGVGVGRRCAVGQHRDAGQYHDGRNQCAGVVSGTGEHGWIPFCWQNHMPRICPRHLGGAACGSNTARPQK